MKTAYKVMKNMILEERVLLQHLVTNFSQSVMVHCFFSFFLFLLDYITNLWMA